MSVQKRLFLIALVAAIAIALVGAVGYASARRVEGALSDSVRLGTALQAQASVAAMTYALKSDVLRAFLAAERRETVQLEQTKRDREEHAAVLAVALRTAERSTRGRPEGESVAALTPILEAFAQKARTLCEESTPGGSFGAESMDDFLADFFNLDDMLKNAQAALQKANAESEVAGRQATTRALLANAAAALLSLTVVFVMVRALGLRIAKPLRACAEAMERASRGDTLQNVKRTSKSDEIGVLQNRIADTIVYLSDMAGVADSIAGGKLVSARRRGEDDTLGTSLQVMSENLRQVIGGTKAAAHKVAAAGGDILISARAALDGAQSQASAIQESTASAAQLTETARVTGDRAREIQAVMAQTVDSSQAIRGQLAKAVPMMSKAPAEMAALALSVKTLVGHNNRIGEIIGTVSELSDQAQLLAINAEIEAAKAGDVGLGFGVVASEMRTLADQSKSAAQKIRAIVSEIQRASVEAQRLGQESQGRLDSAIRPVGQMLPEIEALTLQIDAAGDSVRQILTMVNQQIVGVEQITEALRTIQSVVGDGVRQSQTVEGAAKALNDLSDELQAAIATYTL